MRDDERERRDAIAMLSARVTDGPYAGLQVTGMLVTRKRLPIIEARLAHHQETLTRNLIDASRGAATRDHFAPPPGPVTEAEGRALLAGA